MKLGNKWINGLLVLMLTGFLLGFVMIFFQSGQLKYQLLLGAAVAISSLIRYNRPIDEFKSLNAVDKSFAKYLHDVLRDDKEKRKTLLEAVYEYQRQNFYEAFYQLKTLLYQVQKPHDRAMITFFMALCADGDRQYDEAVKLYESILLLEPTFLDFYNNLGLCYYRLQQYAEAEAALLEALKHNPNNFSTIVNLSSVYTEWGNLDQGFAYAKQAVAMQPKNVLGYQRLALAYATAGDQKQCEEILEKLRQENYNKIEDFTHICYDRLYETANNSLNSQEIVE